jgi:ectoine hydroxylase-related dioxygenase (phytanoyl-CoA dioxygenase family)
MWNARKQCVPVQAGDLILFNSMLDHGVDQITDDKHVRISLAFNTWFVGEIGSKEALTKLSNPL